MRRWMSRVAAWTLTPCLALVACCALTTPPHPAQVRVEATASDAQAAAIARGVIEQVRRTKRLELASGEPAFILRISEVSQIAIARGDGFPNGRDPLDIDPNLEVKASIAASNDRVIGVLSVLCVDSRIAECARGIVRDLERALSER